MFANISGENLHQGHTLRDKQVPVSGTVRLPNGGRLGGNHLLLDSSHGLQRYRGAYPISGLQEGV